MPSLDTITAIILQYRYIIMFPAAAIEGPIITVIIGFLIAAGYFSFFPSLIIIIAADLFSDVLYYLLGRWGRDFSLMKFFRLTQSHMMNFEEHFRKYGFRTITGGKLLHGIGIIVLISAGIARVSILKFLWYNAIATTVKSIVLLLVGYFFGQWISRVQTGLDYFAFGMILLVAIIGLIFLLPSKKKPSV